MNSPRDFERPIGVICAASREELIKIFFVVLLQVDQIEGGDCVDTATDDKQAGTIDCCSKLTRCQRFELLFREQNFPKVRPPPSRRLFR